MQNFLHPACTRNRFLPAVIIITLGCLTGLGGHDLWTPDEPRVAAIAREMADSGDFIIPRLAGEPFVEKPPLYFAAAALMLKLTGRLLGDTAAIRLTSAIFGLGVLLLTFLITRRLWGARTGMMAAAILATMGGFIKYFHWIRVDAALSFFVIATIWCLAEFYIQNRKGMLYGAGLFLAGAFLSKGLIGPVLVAAPWAGLAAVWLFSRRDREKQNRLFLTGHMGMLFIFIIISGLWILLLYVKGGPDLWKEWFWANQVGRLTGQAHLGHATPRQPFYYVIRVAGHGLPWTPLIIYWFGTVTQKWRNMTRADGFLYAWSVGSIVLLTIPVTKRGLYLEPVLPVFAIMSAVSLNRLTSGWFSRYAGFWIAFCLSVITIILALPLAPTALPDTVPTSVQAVLLDYNWHHVMTGIWLILCLLVIVRFRQVLAAEYIMILATAGLFVSLLGIPLQAIDQKKSMAADIQKFVAQIPESQRNRIAGFGFSETIQGAVYYYTGWRIPQVTDPNRIKTILAGQDTTYNSLIVNERDRHGNLHPTSGLVSTPYKILAKAATGTDQERKLFCITGAGGDRKAATEFRKPEKGEKKD